MQTASYDMQHANHNMQHVRYSTPRALTAQPYGGRRTDQRRLVRQCRHAAASGSGAMSVCRGGAHRKAAEHSIGIADQSVLT